MTNSPRHDDHTTTKSVRKLSPAPIVPEMDSIRTSVPRSRQNSAAATPTKPSLDTKPSKDVQSPMLDSKPHYTVFIKLPFPRNDFQDPPPVQWDAIKDRALWKLISTASNSKELDWEEISTRFNVSLPFLLQQAAWLYERHFDAMRAGLKKLNVPSGAPSGTATPAPDGGARMEGGGVGGVAMSRTGSKDSKMPASANMQRQSSLQHGDMDSMPSTPRSNRIMVSRTPSTNTVTQTRFLGSPRQPSRPTSATFGKPFAPRVPKRSSQDDDEAAPEAESDEEPSVLQSQIINRPHLSKKSATGTSSWIRDAEDDEEESSGGSLPFAASARSSKDDSAATLRKSPKRQTVIPQLITTIKPPSKELQQIPHDSSESSASSAQPTRPSNQPRIPNRSEPLSPQQRAELEKLSPRYKKSGSEGSPSIGSSFSDLDDISVNQSALEDALMSNMQYGSIGMGAGSRVSNLRDALGR